MLTSEETKLLDLPDPDTSVGRGSYGVIFRVEVIAGSTWARVFPDHIGSIIAVKEYQASDRPFPGTCTVRTVQNVTYEFLLASLFDHENVVRPFAVSIIGPDDPLAFFPYYSEGSLRRVLKKRRERSLKEPLSTVLRVPEVLAEACLGLLRGIQHVHSKGIVHCDLTDNNILVRLDEKGSAIVLAVHDFGIASRLVDNRTHRRFKTIKEEEQYAATRPHVARELVIGAPFSKESDMYAIGILLRDFLNLENGVRREQLTRERDWEEAVTLVERLTEKLASWRPKCEKVIEAFEKLRQRDRTSLAKRKLF